MVNTIEELSKLLNKLTLINYDIIKIDNNIQYKDDFMKNSNRLEDL